MTISLRNYQIDAIDKIVASFSRGVNKQLITLPTGSGKTIIMAALAKKLGKRTLLLAHREELIIQAEAKFKMIWPEVESGICMADRNEPDKTVVFGSVQSCSRDSRLSQLSKNNFELLLIDEAHHASSASYQKIINTLGFTSENKNSLIVGVTATPMRSDGKELGDTFEEIPYNISVGTMICAGYLSPVVGRRVLTRTNICDVNTRSGDFAIGELSEAINTSKRNKFVAETYLKYASDRKGIVFCCDVQHCKDLAEVFRSVNIPATAIYGDMETSARKEAINHLKTGKIQVATSCGVLTEGFDEPTISCISMARPTRFQGLYIQCVGRGLRLHPSKSDCLVIDFADDGHNLEALASLSRTFPEEQKIGECIELDEKEAREPSIQIKRVCDEEFDILGNARFIWIPIGGDEWSLADDDGNEIVMSPQETGHIAKVYWKSGSESKLVTSPISIEYCSGCCEDFARGNFKLNFASKKADWLTSKLPPTDGQIALLKKKRIDSTGLTKAQAAMRIREFIAKQKKQHRQMNSEPMTNKQAYFLREFGANEPGMTKSQAMKVIANIKKERSAVNA